MPCASSVPLLRVWLPFQRTIRPSFPESDICFQRSWVFHFKAFFLLSDRKRISPLHPFLHFIPTLSLKRLEYRCFNGLIPPKKLSPCLSAYFFKCYLKKVRGVCFLMIHHLPGFPPTWPSFGSISLPNSPLSQFARAFLRGRFALAIGFLCHGVGYLPLRAPTCRMFLTFQSPNLLRK